MRRLRARGVQEEATINLTPLIDVVFVILIMFIVIAPLLEVDRIQLAEGVSETSISESSPILIHVHADNTITYNKVPITLESLPTYLARARRESPTSAPHLYHDARASFGTYQAVKNAVEQAGFSTLDVILKPK